MVFLNSNPIGRHWGKTLTSNQAVVGPKSTRTEATCARRIVKFGKGMDVVPIRSVKFQTARCLCLVGLCLVTEVAHSGEEHGEAQAVGGSDDFGIALRSAGLDDCGGAGFRDLLDAVGKWEEGVGGCDGSL
jgi:hypothetical protein